MNFTNGLLRPGRVLSVEDDYGTIKACVEGYLSDKDETDKLPPIYPMFSLSHNAFSKPKVNDLIWVFIFTDNHRALFYVKQNIIQEQLGELLDNSYEEVEVLARKEAGFSWAQIYFTDQTGWVIQNDSSQMQIDKDGNIILQTQNKYRTIKIDEDAVHLGGDTDTEQPAVLGDNLVKTLDKIEYIFTAISNACTTPYTAPIKMAMEALLKQYSESIDSVTSNNVKLN